VTQPVQNFHFQFTIIKL